MDFFRAFQFWALTRSGVGYGLGSWHVFVRFALLMVVVVTRA